MIRTSRAHLRIEAHTHPGMSGKNNEDRYAVASFHANEKDRTPVVFAVLADGIGGHQGGEVAAELAVNHIMQSVAKGDGKFSQHIIEQAVNEASSAIASHSSTNDELKGMGATCVIVWIIENKLYTAYVGDSRIYLMRAGQIQQLTIDHSWVQEAIEKGILTPELARDHPNVHVIRRYLGSPVPPEPDFRLTLSEGEDAKQAENNQGMELQPNDVLLLCSDGLTDLVWNDEILEVVRTKSSLKEASRALVDLANERGGHDNITVVLIGVPEDYIPKDETKNKETKKKDTNWLPWIIGGAGLFLFLVVASILAFNLFRSNGTLTATPAVSATLLATVTPMISSTPTIIPTETASPDVVLPVEPTFTLTPWPTNTTTP
ncbi:MAG TPA: protein phosphatase 2C domain-containing protein [Anaerolineales bacterium]|nr:protein phosphatase 2C domain-containing protein [Anaerolineales bacterium]